MSPEDTVVRMPKLADTLVEGTVGQWLKRVGDSVARGEPLASIETDKVTTELTSPAAGTLLEQLVVEGETVPIETPIARIGAVLQPALKPRVTPVAARMLADHGLTAEQVPARARRLTRDDVLAFVEKTPRRTVAPLSPMRRAIAEHMTRAVQGIPHGQVVAAADLTELVGWREAHKSAFEAGEGAPLTFTVLFVYALARKLTPPADIGVAVALDSGLIVPVVRHADGLSLGETARQLAGLAARARARQLALEDTQGAQMTLTNVGSFGNLTAAPIIPVGQRGILGPGLVERRPLPAPDGGIRPGWRCLVSFVYDRRELNDFAADRFVTGVVDALRSVPSRSYVSS